MYGLFKLYKDGRHKGGLHQSENVDIVPIYNRLKKKVESGGFALDPN